MDDYDQRHSGSRIGVLLIGLLIGALAMTAVWVAVAGNPLSDDNEVEYLDITVASLNEEDQSICWSDDPQRRDAVQLCAILALDPKAPRPEVGDAVNVGVVNLRPPNGTQSRQVVYVSAARRGGASGTPSPSPAPTD